VKLLGKLVIALFFTCSFAVLLKALFLPGYSDFSAYYYVPKMAFGAVNPYIGQQNLFTATTYPPFSFIFFVPFLVFPFLIAAKILTFLSIAALFASIILIFKTVRLRIKSYLFLLICGLSFYYFPTRFTLGMGQINLIILLFITAFLYFLDKKQKILSGLFLSLSIAIKLFPVLLLPYLLIKRQYKILLSACLAILIFIFLSFIFIPKEINNYFYLKIFPTFFNVFPTDYYNQSITGVVGRGVADTSSRVILKTVFVLIFLIATFWVLIKSKIKNINLETGYIICASLLINAFSWQHHFVWLFLPLIFTLLFLIKKSAKRLLFIILGISYALCALNLKQPYAFPVIVQSHVFFGTLVLWLLDSYLLLKSNK
jgi:alpha-1,2-mannosyltransferase